MSIFSSKKEKEVPAKKAVSAVKAVFHSHSERDLSSVLLNPRVTEKASQSAQKNVYVFEVAPKATKKTIADAVKEYYKISPLKIGIVNLPRKKIMARGKIGMRGGGKKAYVYLKEGDKIEAM